jgi:tRNA 5-methylaminomethyl-2-thiouridine biosynthesis bifunctional protein
MMRRAPTPARIDFASGVPHAPDYGDVYHARAGAMGQARHVFLGGNGLPGAWQGQRRFAILETGFGLGHNFLATWQAWRDDPKRCERLDYVSVELHPPGRADLLRALAGGDAPSALAGELAAGWPPPMPGLHRLAFEGGNVVLWLALGDARDLLPALTGRFDAFYLDGFAPARNPEMWDRRLLAAAGRLAAPGATAATWSVAAVVREGLVQAGFEVGRQRGYDRKREMTVARHVPRHTPRRLPGRAGLAAATAPRPGRAVVVGAGLAGAAVAQALAARGWSCTVLDRADAPACGASGNPAGLFHGTLHEADGPHARLLRAGALLAAPVYAQLIARGVPGAADGLVAWQRERQPVPCPPDYARHGDAAATAAWTGLDLPGPATLYQQAGWVDPGAVVRAWLSAPGVTFKGGVEIAALRPSSPEAPATDRSADAGATMVSRPPGWQVMDAAGRIVETAEVVVVAGGTGLPSIDGPDGPPDPLLGWEAVRGQITWFEGPAPLRRPLTGQGYALSLPDGRLLCGATAHRGDAEPALRAADTAFNLARLNELTGLEPAPGGACGGRVGWRLGTADRLPVIGAWPNARAAASGRRDQARFIARHPGLFLAGGFGSRGLTWAPLAAEVLAAWIDGTPMPLESDLLDAIDPARALVRQWRRAGQAAMSD